MSVALKFVTGGLQTTVQDLGRMGRQSLGIPVGGPMDRTALQIANLLVGNDETSAALEAALIGPAITFDQPTLIALAGADLEPTINGTDVPTWHAIQVPRAATLRFGRPRVGCRVYIAVAGGIDVPPVFDSRSTYLRAEFGGHEGRALRSGDSLVTGTPSLLSERISRSLTERGDLVARWSIGGSLRPSYSEDVIVRLVDGAHVDSLNDESRRKLFEATFRVSASSDRMGYRLDGVELLLAKPLELLSEAVAFGTVQLPAGGAPIILMADRQTTGGYPRVGEVASIDLPLVAQLKPGDRLRFRPISVAEAQRLYVDHALDVEQARTAIRFRYCGGAR